MSFNVLAPHYRWMEAVLAGGKLQQCRTHFLNSIGEPKHILTVGEGPGRFLVACAKRFPNIRITVMDSSDRMLAVARKQLTEEAPDFAQVRFVQADLLSHELVPEKFDVIATHFFLDCFTAGDLENVVKKLSCAAMTDACWLLSDFQIPDRGVRRVRALIIHAMMYLFFRNVTGLRARFLTPPDELLAKQGFALKGRWTTDLDLIRSDLWQRHAERMP